MLKEMNPWNQQENQSKQARIKIEEIKLHIHALQQLPQFGALDEYLLESQYDMNWIRHRKELVRG